ncbi:MAG: xanthine dehydrogenase family protein molybdopterin-binding subunit, partial [Gammaproteobacteria bacterium]|nr:xanthine dehydrogenase family protein molybdopterin-binding subunit [Gammaproteobacteria bacterium]
MSITGSLEGQPPRREDGRRVSRRGFMLAAATAGGGLALTLALPAPAQQLRPRAWGAPASAAPRPPSAFLQIGEDDAITVISPAVEMGQGDHTAMAMIILEELCGDWRRLRKVDDAEVSGLYNNPLTFRQLTVGSYAVRGWYMELRRIGAAAREMLVQAAAHDWNVPAQECTAAASIIVHRPSGRRRSFGSVCALAARLPVPQKPILKPAEAFTLIGTSPPRVDIPSKVDGSAAFGIDVKVPGMLLAAVKTCPTFGGKLKSFDDSVAKRMPGFHATVVLPDGVIVVGQTYWQAKKALDEVKVEYDHGPLAELDGAKVSRLLHAGFEE